VVFPGSKEKKMETNANKTVSSHSWVETIAGTAPFVYLGLVLIVIQTPSAQSFQTWIIILFLGVLLLPPIGLCIGWIKGFPRWSYPYVSHVITISVFMMGISTPGFLFGEELWMWRALIPLGIAVLIALIVTRSAEPLVKFFTNLWEDWTLLSFGIFGLLPWRAAFYFDGVTPVLAFYTALAFAVIMSGSALLYMRANGQRQRITALLIGSVLIATIVILFYPRNGAWFLRWISFGLSPTFPYFIELWRRAMLKWDSVELSNAKVP